MLRSRRTALATLVFGATAILIAGLLFGPRTVSGTATTADIALHTLDFGDLGAEPLAEPGNDNERYSRIIESARMSEAVVNPIDIDDSLRPRVPTLLPKPTDTTGILADVARPILVKYGMLAGYSVRGDNSNRTRSVRVTALRFPDEAAARSTATEIEAADFASNPENAAVSLPEYPAALGHWRPSVPTLGIVIAHGSFVVTLFVTYPTTDLGALTALANASMKAELATLDRFQPTPVRDMPNLRFDTDGMLRRMVPTVRGEWPMPYITKIQADRDAGGSPYIESSGVVYGPTGAAHWMSTDPKNQDAASDDIESLAVVDRRWLIRLRDATAARIFAAGETQSSNRQTPMASPRIPDTKCLRREEILPVYYCVVQDGRYVSVVWATDEKSVHQMAAAQYALFVRNR